MFIYNNLAERLGKQIHTKIHNCTMEEWIL